MNHHVNSFCCIDQQVEITKGKLPLLGSAPNELTVERLESREDDYSGPTLDKSSTEMDYFPNIMRHQVFLSEHATLHPHTQFWPKVVT